ncbi:ATP-binding cassette domain-containing protein [Bradyrhizobium cenepequi]
MIPANLRLASSDTYRPLRSPWALAVLLASVAAAFGILLTGVSAWFLGAVALAGLGPAALSFNFHTPAALVRLFALGKTASKYGERVVGHRAALIDQVTRRARLFEAMARTPSTRAASWQFGNQDRLADYMEDVEDVDTERLRATLPIAMLGAGAAALTVATAWLVPPALLAVAAVFLCVCAGYWRVVAQAGTDWSDVRGAQRRAGRLVGAALGALVPLRAERSFETVLDDGFEALEAAENARLSQRQKLAAFEFAATIPGPLVAVVVMLFAWHTGLRGDALLMPAFLSFAWLALGEGLRGFPRIVLGRVRASAARDNLSAWGANTGAQGNRSKSIKHLDLLTLNKVPRRSPDGRPLGEPLDLVLRAGQPTMLVGPSGSGKTTLLKQIAGWIGDDQEGRFTASGVVVLAGARRAVTHLCLHDAMVLSDTIRENLFAPNASDAACWEALRAVELDSRISAAGGLDAWIRQDRLSLGEAQRLNLARTLLSECPIVLLDEPTEHLDASQGERILREILGRLSGRIVVFTSHRSDPTRSAVVQV